MALRNKSVEKIQKNTMWLYTTSGTSEIKLEQEVILFTIARKE